jgi:hypothetical protein
VSALVRNGGDSDELVIEVDGEGVHLATLDAPGVLNLASCYLDLLARCAADLDEMIEFRGLRAFENCGSLGTYPSDPELARRSVLDAARLLASRDRPGHGLKIAVDRVRQARAALPPHYRAIVKFGSIARDISPEPASVLDQTPYATASLRARVQRVGGAFPRATFTSKSEAKVFHLDLRDHAQASDLGIYLYKTVDIVARVGRDPDGNIEEGVLREFYPVGGDSGSEWADWFKESGVVSLEELGKNRDGRRGDG